MEDQAIPPFVLAEREALIQEIKDAFAGVTRVGGVSWSEADVIDEYGSDEDRASAREKDTDSSWEEVFADPDWPHNGFGGWSFLDAIGFLYYLPAGMIHSIRKGYDTGILFHLVLSGEPSLRTYELNQWSLINQRQSICIKRFLQYMAVTEDMESRLTERGNYGDALAFYWNDAGATDSLATSPDEP